MTISPLNALALIVMILVGSAIFWLIFDHFLQHVSQHAVSAMNRDIAKFDVKGWMVLMNLKRHVVGLYYDGHAVSHARIHVGKELRERDLGEHLELTINDFRIIDVDIPRFSYRALYEYAVPHSTRVIIYRK